MSTSTNAIASQICQDLRPNIPKKYVVVCGNPVELEDSIRAEWEREIAQLQHARKNDAGLSSELAIMESVIFASAPPADMLQADVLLGHANEFDRFPPSCDVLILATPVTADQLSRIRRNIAPGGRIIDMAN